MVETFDTVSEHNQSYTTPISLGTHVDAVEAMRLLQGLSLTRFLEKSVDSPN